MNKNFYKRQRLNTKIKSRVDRLHLLVYFFSLAALIIILQLANLQILRHQFFSALAAGQHELYQKLFPARGEVYIQDPYAENGLSAIITNRDYHLIYANPSQIADPRKVSDELAPILGLDPEVLYARLNKPDDVYEPIKNKATDLEMEEIKKMQITGINWREESWRYYTEGAATAHLTGFLGITDDQKVGQYGLEGYWEEELAGKQGELISEKDAGGQFIALGKELLQEKEDGKDLVLTIDKNIQFYTCDRLQAAVEAHGAKEGTAIIVEPKTGSLIALCNYPSFDPNNYNQVDDLQVYINSAVNDQYEPGSVFKALTMAAALDLGKVTPETTYNDTGSVVIGNSSPIQNSDGKAYGVVNMQKVLEFSLNTGSIFAAQQIGNEAFYQYVQKFGFGEKTEVELAGEQAGDLSEIAKLKDIYTATASYGQGLTVTPLQLVMAYASLANEGKLMRPYLVKQVLYPSGYQEAREPQMVRQVVSAQTARILSAMLVNVVDNGHAKGAQLPGYYIGGKTGTAQVPMENGGGYDPYRHKDSFVGYGPISDPQFVILTKIDEPNDVAWAEGSALPLFHEIEQFLVNYYHIPPDRE